VKEGTFRRGAPRGNPSSRTQLFAADRRTSHDAKKEETLRCRPEVPEETERRTIQQLETPEVFNILTKVFIVPW